MHMHIHMFAFIRYTRIYRKGFFLEEGSGTKVAKLRRRLGEKFFFGII